MSSSPKSTRSQAPPESRRPIHMHQRVAMFVDVQNMFYSAKALYLTAAVYAILLAMCLQGVGIWRREHDAQRVARAALP